MNMDSTIDFDHLWQVVSDSPHHRSPYSIHGPDHWRRVERNAVILAARTGARIEVVRLFALFHDSKRINEGWDPGHGRRGAMFAAQLRGEFGRGRLPDPELLLARIEAVLDASLDDPSVRLRAQVALQDGAITTLEPVYFDSRQATIQARSYALLDEVAAVLTSHPALRVRIEGHTDDRGGGAANRDLSERRAAAVRAYLVDRGIAADRLAAQGFGEAQPIADNHTAAGRASNRRVVFAIIPPTAP